MDFVGIDLHKTSSQICMLSEGGELYRALLEASPASRRSPDYQRESLLRSLDKISAADASRSVNDGATIAAHAQHVRYGLSLMNRWAAGESPFADADWTASIPPDAPMFRAVPPSGRSTSALPNESRCSFSPAST